MLTLYWVKDETLSSAEHDSKLGHAFVFEPSPSSTVTYILYDIPDTTCDSARVTQPNLKYMNLVKKREYVLVYLVSSPGVYFVLPGF